MRVSWKWLNELVDINLKPEELAEVMTMSGVAVEGIEYLNKGVRGVIVGLIQEIYPHPQADKLSVCKVSVGDVILTIVTGASNVKVGQKVPVAVPGAVLPEKKIERAVFRGLESEGMLCSADELGMDADKLPPEQRDGILILAEECPVGADIVPLLGLDDIVLELELTPNRADCLSMINVAREVAALTGGRLKLPEIEKSGASQACEALIKINIQDQDLCKRYVGRVIEHVQIKESPLWLKQRLLAAGVRPINNIVDITNYVMMEMGQPLHAFDYDCLADKTIIVRRAADGEEITTLDGKKRELTPEMLVIADAHKPVGIAGVMGGLESEVTAQTKTILLESAYFHGPSIRRTSNALALRSEASLRFEKGVDLEQVSLAADRACQLMAQLGAGVPVEGQVDCYPHPEERYPIRLRLERVNSILGTDLGETEVEKILKALNITILERDLEGWHVFTPSYRRDLELEIDLIEEIARLNGYDKIPTTLPYGATTQGAKNAEQRLHDRISEIMVGQGLFEVITYSFINPRHLDWLYLPPGHELRQTVVVSNPLSEEQGIMRTTILPGLLETVKRNINKRNKNLKLFELGKVYLSSGFPGERKLPQEKWVLGAISTGKKEKTWAYGEENYDFFFLKGVAENIFSSLGLGDVSFVKSENNPSLHPGRCARIIVGGKKVGFIGEVHPLVLEKYGIEQRAAVFSLYLDELIGLVSEAVRYQPVPRFPAVTRDLAIVVPEAVEAGQVLGVIKDTGKTLLKNISLFDVYRGQQIREGYKSLAFSLTWQAEDRTLTDEEVNKLHREIEAALARELGADLRR
jgi:phenylalanyl-tRNA synthetase beta chain